MLRNVRLQAKPVTMWKISNVSDNVFFITFFKLQCSIIHFSLFYNNIQQCAFSIFEKGGLSMQINKKPFIHLNVYLPEETIAQLNGRAAQTNMPVSSIARELINNGLRQEIVDENAGVVASIVRSVVKDVVHAEAERLAKLIIKTMKASAAGMYLASQAIEDIGHNQGSAMLEEALKMATKYIKVAYDPKDYIDVPSKIADQLGTITDDDLFTMTI